MANEKTADKKVGTKHPEAAGEQIAQSAEIAGEDPWISRVADVKRFVQQRGDYEHLANEVAYSLVKLLDAAGIKIVAVTGRAKTLESFLEKIGRKHYTNPFSEVTDFAGVRVVCYYPEDLGKVEVAIRTEFAVVSSEDKISARGIDQFGYSAKHYLVKLGQGTKGARYDAIKKLVCEIQVRTVLQDAWAVFSHHLMYKHENDIPEEIKRRLNALAGLLESADTMFQQIRDDRDKYVKNVEASSARELGGITLNRDSLEAWLKSLPKGRRIESTSLGLDFVLWALQKIGCKSISDVSGLFQRTAEARKHYYQMAWPNLASTSHPYASNLLVAAVLTHPEITQDEQFREMKRFSDRSEQALVEARKKLT